MSTENDDVLPNLVTIVGRGVPSNYEITVSGDIELIGADPLEEATVVTDHSAEGAVDIGVMRFRFSGEGAVSLSVKSEAARFCAGLWQKSTASPVVATGLI